MVLFYEREGAEIADWHISLRLVVGIDLPPVKSPAAGGHLLHSVEWRA